MKAVALHLHGVKALPEALRNLRHTLTSWALEVGITQDRAQDIALASYEALANVADHAYRGDGSGLVDLDAIRHPDRVQVVITDHGKWQPPVHDPSPVSLRGRGLMLLRASADEADITAGDDGTVVTLTWDLAGDVPA